MWILAAWSESSSALEPSVYRGMEKSWNVSWGGCLENRQGRTMYRSWGYGYIKPMHVTRLVLQASLEQRCSAEEPLNAHHVYKRKRSNQKA